MKKKKTELKALNKMHFNFESWESMREKLEAIGIKTFGELEMYCRVWGIENQLQLLDRVTDDYVAVLLEKRDREVKGWNL